MRQSRGTVIHAQSDECPRATQSLDEFLSRGRGNGFHVWRSADLFRNLACDLLAHGPALCFLMQPCVLQRLAQLVDQYL